MRDCHEGIVLQHSIILSAVIIAVSIIIITRKKEKTENNTLLSITHSIPQGRGAFLILVKCLFMGSVNVCRLTRTQRTLACTVFIAVFSKRLT